MGKSADGTEFLRTLAGSENREQNHYSSTRSRREKKYIIYLLFTRRIMGFPSLIMTQDRATTMTQE
jgi:hypothetical protein